MGRLDVWLICLLLSSQMVKNVNLKFSYESVTAVLARITLTYTDRYTKRTESGTGEIGRFAKGGVGTAGGILVTGRTPDNTTTRKAMYSQGCIQKWSTPPSSSEPWVALLHPGGCSDKDKVKYAFNQNASAVLLFGTDLGPHNSKESQFKGNVVVVYLLQRRGEILASLVENGTKVYVTITKGQEVKFRSSVKNNYGAVEDKWQKEMNMVDVMINRFDRENIREILRYLSDKPHIAASPRDNELAEYVRTKFEEAGFDSSELVPYNIFLSKPNPENPNKITLDMKGETIFESHFKEVPIHEDDDDQNFVHSFLAFTPSGTVSTEPGVGVVYVNYGRIEDFEKLTELGINVTGHIVIARYGEIFRGNKVQLAEKFGAKGIILFSDPKDVALDGIAPENVYDHNWWLPGTGMQRGSTYLGGGDSLTPGWPSTEHAYRLTEDEANLPKIPGQPIGYSDAIQILKRLDGLTAPDEWQGGYPNFKYKLGPFFNDQNGSVSLTLSTHNSRKVERSHNVIGVIKGCIEPDRYVLIGNHRDAWGYGAVDPSSGTAQMLETARVLGTFLKEGWRPRRTIIFCSWGAEEFGVVGSTEWVEENVDKLQSRAVGYLNSDLCTFGPELTIMGSPLIQGLFMDITKLIPGVKNSSKTLFEEWREYGERLSPNAKEYPIIKGLNTGSDHFSFALYAGIPSADFAFAKDESKYKFLWYPTYHTGYETFYMVSSFIDPEFKMHEGCGRVSLLSLKYLADSSILPYSLARLPSIMLSNLQNNVYRERLIQIYDKYTELENSMKKFEDSVSKFESMIKSSTSLSELQVRAINDQMMKLEQIFLIPEGLPGRPTVRNAAFAQSQFNIYASSGFPGLSDLLYDFDTLNQTEQQSRTKVIKRHVSDLTIMTDRAASFLKDVYLI